MQGAPSCQLLIADLMFDDFIILDGLIKSPLSRHSREGGSPEALEKTGFPPTRE
jgi:hypothetical protein